MNFKQKLINKVNAKKALFSKKEYVYVLTHTHDPIKVIVKLNVDPDTMELLLAYMQFKAADILEEFHFDQMSISELLEKHLKAKHLEHYTGTYYEIDLFGNWEIWSDISDEVEEIKLFHNDEFDQDINNLVYSAIESVKTIDERSTLNQ